MLWLHDIILAPGSFRLVPRLPELQVHGPALGIHLVSRGGACGQGRFDGAGTEDPKDLALDRLVDAEAAKGEAPVGSVIEGCAPAAVPRDVPLGPRVGDMQAPATLPAPHRSSPGSRLDPRRTAPRTIRPFICALFATSARFRS